MGYYTAKNATDLMQVGDSTQPDASCQQVVSSLLTSSSCIKSCEHIDICRLAAS